MRSLSIYSVKQVKEKCGLYELDSKFIKSPKSTVDIINAVLDLSGEASEKFGIITLTSKFEVAGFHIIAIGSLDAAIVHPREVFKAAILNNAAAIICFHNHPSGDPTPSDADMEVTERLVGAGKLVGIKVLDHVIIGDNRFISLAEQGSVQFEGR